MFENMTDEDVVRKTHDALKLEDRATTNVVRHFVEVISREIFLKRGFSTPHEFIMNEFRIAKPSAQRRINAAQLAIAVPEVLGWIDQSRLYLQSAADIQTFLNFERGRRRKYSNEQKRELVISLLDLSTREIHERLAEKNPDVTFKDSKKLIAPGNYKVVYVTKVETEEKLDRIKDLRSSVNPFATRDDLVDYLAELALEKIDPVRKAARHQAKAELSKPKSDARDSSSRLDQAGEFSNSSDQSAQADERDLIPAEGGNAIIPAQERVEVVDEVVSDAGEIQLVPAFLQKSRYITAEEKRKVSTEAGCCFVDEKTGRRCGSKRIQFDHIQEFSRGGANTAENLQPMCGAHNRLRYRQRSRLRNEVRSPRAEYHAVSARPFLRRR